MDGIRDEILAAFDDSWHEIVAAYLDGRIAWEEDLRCRLYGLLAPKLPSADVWAEPRWAYHEDDPALSRLRPDLVISTPRLNRGSSTDAYEIVGAIECKHVPQVSKGRAARSFAKDLATFGRLQRLTASGSVRTRLALDPIRGTRSEPNFHWAENVALILATIGPCEPDTSTGRSDEVKAAAWYWISARPTVKFGHVCF